MPRPAAEIADLRLREDRAVHRARPRPNSPRPSGDGRRRSTSSTLVSAHLVRLTVRRAVVANGALAVDEISSSCVAAIRCRSRCQRRPVGDRSDRRWTRCTTIRIPGRGCSVWRRCARAGAAPRVPACGGMVHRRRREAARPSCPRAGRGPERGGHPPDHHRPDDRGRGGGPARGGERSEQKHRAAALAGSGGRLPPRPGLRASAPSHLARRGARGGVQPGP